MRTSSMASMPSTGGMSGARMVSHGSGGALYGHASINGHFARPGDDMAGVGVRHIDISRVGRISRPAHGDGFFLHRLSDEQAFGLLAVHLPDAEAYLRQACFALVLVCGMRYVGHAIYGLRSYSIDIHEIGSVDRADFGAVGSMLLHELSSSADLTGTKCIRYWGGDARVAGLGFRQRSCGAWTLKHDRGGAQCFEPAFGGRRWQFKACSTLSSITTDNVVE